MPLAEPGEPILRQRADGLGQPCAADDACRPWDGTLAARATTSARATSASTKFAVKDWRHRGCDGAPEPDVPQAPRPRRRCQRSTARPTTTATRRGVSVASAGARAARGVGGSALVEAPPAPWAFMRPRLPGGRRRGRGRARGARRRAVPDARRRRRAAARRRRAGGRGPRGRAAEGSTGPKLLQDAEPSFLRNLGRHDVFVNLELAADPKITMEDARWNHAGRAVGAPGRGAGAAALRPRLVTLGEPRIEGFADGGNAWNSATGTRARGTTILNNRLTRVLDVARFVHPF